MKPQKMRLPPPQPETARLSNTVTFGMHLYRTKDEDPTVYYVDDSRGIKRMVVDERGRFCDFPVVITEKFWLDRLIASDALKNQIRYRTGFEKINGGFLVLWCVQPDGRYFEDGDGFGAEAEEEITLYSFLDTDGKICAPFRLYRLGEKVFYEGDSAGSDDAPAPIPSPSQDGSGETVLVQGVKRDTQVFKEVMWIVTFLGNALILFTISLLSGEYDTYYGKSSPYSSIFEYMLDDILWIFIIALALFNLVCVSLALRLPERIKKQSLTVTDESVSGTDLFSRTFDLAREDLTDVRYGKTKLVFVSNSGKFSAHFFKNAKEIYDACSALLKTAPAPAEERTPEEVRVSAGKQPRKLLPKKERPAKERPAKDRPAKERPAKDRPAKDRPAKDRPAKERSAKSRTFAPKRAKAPRNNEGVVDTLERLKALLDGNAITQEEFDRLKQELLNGK